MCNFLINDLMQSMHINQVFSNTVTNNTTHTSVSTQRTSREYAELRLEMFQRKTGFPGAHWDFQRFPSEAQGKAWSVISGGLI